MIRFGIGFLLVYGGVGGMEHQPEYFTEQLIATAIGLLLMIWAVPKLASQGDG